MNKKPCKHETHGWFDNQTLIQYPDHYNYYCYFPWTRFASSSQLFFFLIWKKKLKIRKSKNDFIDLKLPTVLDFELRSSIFGILYLIVIDLKFHQKF